MLFPFKPSLIGFCSPGFSKFIMTGEYPYGRVLKWGVALNHPF